MNQDGLAGELLRAEPQGLVEAAVGYRVLLVLAPFIVVEPQVEIAQGPARLFLAAQSGQIRIVAQDVLDENQRSVGFFGRIFTIRGGKIPFRF